MVCTKCGHEVPDGEEYCQFCGLKIKDAKGMNGVINEVFPDANEEAGDKEGVSVCGTITKVLAVIVMILGVVGGFSMMSDAGFSISITVILLTLLFGMICYGIGEICCILKDINSKIK